MSLTENRSHSENKNHFKKFKIIQSKSNQSIIKERNSREESKIKIGFNHLLKPNKNLTIEALNDKPSKIKTNIIFIRQFNSLRNNNRFYLEKVNNLNIPNKKEFNNILTDPQNNPTISLFNSNFKPIEFSNKNLLRNKGIFLENKILKINNKHKDFDNTSNNKIKKVFNEKIPIKINNNKYKNIKIPKEKLTSTQSNFYYNKPQILSGYKEFLTKYKVSNLPTLVNSISNTNVNQTENNLDDEKIKYNKISETFLKIKCLLSLDCEPGNERKYIKNFFLRFGYNNNEISEDKITNFLNFLNIEPFQINPSKSLKENIILAMNNKIEENEI
jgi:hypothetical protein